MSELNGNLAEVCHKLATGLEQMTIPERMSLCSQLIDKVLVDGHSAEIHYKFPVSRNCNRSGEAITILMQMPRLLSIM